MSFVDSIHELRIISPTFKHLHNALKQTGNDWILSNLMIMLARDDDSY